MGNFKKLRGVESVFYRDNEIIITGSPTEDDEGHSCDEMGCGSIDHVLLRGHFSVLTKGYSPAMQEVE